LSRIRRVARSAQNTGNASLDEQQRIQQQQVALLFPCLVLLVASIVAANGRSSFSSRFFAGASLSLLQYSTQRRLRSSRNCTYRRLQRKEERTDARDKNTRREKAKKESCKRRRFPQRTDGQIREGGKRPPACVL